MIPPKKMDNLRKNISNKGNLFLSSITITAFIIFFYYGTIGAINKNYNGQYLVLISICAFINLILLNILFDLRNFTGTPYTAAFFFMPFIYGGILSAIANVLFGF
tara:strand:- start:313 stop:627 length:315 start_codon:yes stop_codon:yes gene_type:complete